MRARPVRVALLVGADRELRDVAVHRALGHVEADMAAAGAALLGADQRQVDRIGHEIGHQQQALLLALGAEIVGLAVEAVLEVVRGVEDEVDVLVEIDHRRRVGDGDVARRRLARAVEMLVPAVERNGEHGARLPLEGDAAAFVVPHRGRAAAVEHQDHLLEQLALRRELLARRNLADVAVVRGARGLVVDVDAGAAAPRPGLELDGAQIAHVVRADDVEALAAHPAQIGRVLLGGEFLRQLFRNDGVLGHANLSSPCSYRRNVYVPAPSYRTRSRRICPPSYADRSASPVGVRSDGCAFACSRTSPTLTWKSR